MAKFLKDLKMHPEAVDALEEVKSGFHLLDVMMTRLGRISAGADIGAAHDLLTTAWVAVRKIKLYEPSEATSFQEKPEAVTVDAIKKVANMMDECAAPTQAVDLETGKLLKADPFTSW